MRVDAAFISCIQTIPQATEACLTCGLKLLVSELPDHLEECEKAL